MKKVSFLVLIAVFACQMGFAEDRWSGGQNGAWNDDVTWNGGSYVTGADTGYLNGGTTVTVDGTSEEAATVWVASWSGSSDTSTLNVSNGGSLSIGGQLLIGVARDDGAGWVDTGVVNVDSGSTLATGGNLEVGHNGNGTLNVYGDVTVGGDLYAPNPWGTSDDSEVNLYDGVLTVNGFGMNSSGKVNITDGELRILGDWYVTTIGEYEGQGLIIGNLGAGELSITLDGDYTVVRAVPEPMTISLLGLGAIGLLRKRRN